MKMFRCEDGTMIDIQDISNIIPQYGFGRSSEVIWYYYVTTKSYPEGEIEISVDDYAKLLAIMKSEGLMVE